MAKTFTGVVSSDRADKTIVVTIQTRKTHPIYKKQYTVSKKFMAHDENNEAKQGDTVTISETRPLSANKRFKLDRVVERAAIQHSEAEPVVPGMEASEEKPAKKAANNEAEETSS